MDIDKEQTVTYEMDNDPSQNFTIESSTGKYVYTQMTLLIGHMVPK